MEIAIALVVVALLVAGSKGLVSGQLDRYKTQTTNNNLHAIEEAIVLHKEKNNLLPCPAFFSALAKDKGEAASGGCDVDPTGNSICTGKSLHCSGNVVIGLVPYSTLGINRADTVDGWGNRIIYAVDKRFTKDFATKAGDITLVDVEDNVVANSDTMGGVVFVLFSHGKNGAGAYKGDMIFDGKCTSSMKDYENCNRDATFRVAPNNKHPEDFDDIVIWRTKGSLQ